MNGWTTVCMIGWTPRLLLTAAVIASGTTFTSAPLAA